MLNVVRAKHVRDHRERDDRQAEFVSHQHFGNGGHADDIAERAQPAVLRASFVIGTEHRDVGAATKWDVFLGGDAFGKREESRIVERRTGTLARRFRTDGQECPSYVAHQIDMVVDQQDVAGAQQRVHPTARV